MKKENIDQRKVATVFVSLTLILTWAFQFMPMILKMDVSETSVSSFDPASVFFAIGGMLPSLIGTIFVLVLYKKENVGNFLKRCFVPTKKAVLAILISLAFICFESFVVQSVSRMFGGSPLGFMGLKMIIDNPLMFFYFLFWGLISGPLSEEVGWRGFLSDMIITRTSLYRNALEKI